MKIAILSRGEQLYSTQSLIKAAEIRGHSTKLLDVTALGLFLEKGAQHLIYHGKRLQKLDAIIPRIATNITYQGASAIRQLEGINILTTTTSEGLLKCRDKLITLQFLASKGFLVPPSYYPSSDLSEKYAIKDLGGWPIIMKTLASTHGEGVYLAKNKKQVDDYVEYLKRTGQRFMFQKFIKESNGEDLRIFVIDGEVVACMKRIAAIGDFRSNLHMGGSAKPYILDKETADMAIKAVKIMGLTVAGVDVLESQQGPMILEVNASPGLEGIENTTGVDVAGKFIDYLERQFKIS